MIYRVCSDCSLFVWFFNSSASVFEEEEESDESIDINRVRNFINFIFWIIWLTDQMPVVLLVFDRMWLWHVCLKHGGFTYVI